MSSEDEEYSSDQHLKQSSIRSFLVNKEVKNEELNDEEEVVCLENNSNDELEESEKSDVEMKEEIDSSFEGYVGLPPKKKRKKYVRIKKQGECVECKKQKEIHAKNMCAACYGRYKRQMPEYNVPNCCCIQCMAVAKVDKHGICRKCSNANRDKLRREDVSKHRECKACKKTRLIQAHDLCDTCYQRSTPKTKQKCQDCGQLKIIHSKNTCANCQTLKRAKTDIRMCKNCGYMKPHYADKMCHQCYNKTRRNDVRQCGECNKCGQIEFISGHGMCGNCCYHSRKEDSSKHKKCVKCGETKFIKGHGMCRACYSKENKHKLKLDTTKHRECARCKQLKPIECREMCNACYRKIFTTPKRRLAKKQKQPKPEPISDKEDLNERAVSPASINEEDFKLEPLTDDEMRAVSPASIEEFKMENLSDEGQKPGPSWKY